MLPSAEEKRGMQLSEECSKKCFMGGRIDRNYVNPERCVCPCYANRVEHKNCFKAELSFAVFLKAVCLALHSSSI